MNPFESNVSDADIEREFAGTNFGDVNHRRVLEQGVLKQLVAYHSGHTLTQIMVRLGLINNADECSVTAKGKRFLFAAFHDRRHS